MPHAEANPCADAKHKAVQQNPQRAAHENKSRADHKQREADRDDVDGIGRHREKGISGLRLQSLFGATNDR